MNKPWGFHLILDLYNCNPEKIRNADIIKEFIIKLCDLIQMTRYGEPLLVRFGKEPSVSGYSLCQLIEESNINGHFIEQTNCACIDVFSCKEFSVAEAQQFCVEFFDAEQCEFSYIERLNIDWENY